MSNLLRLVVILWTIIIIKCCCSPSKLVKVERGIKKEGEEYDEFVYERADPEGSKVNFNVEAPIQPIALAAEMCTIVGGCQAGTFIPGTVDPRTTFITLTTTSFTTEFTTRTVVTQFTLTSTNIKTTTTTITSNAISVSVRTVKTTIPLTITATTSLTRYNFSDYTVFTTVTSTTLVYTTLSFTQRVVYSTTISYIPQVSRSTSVILRSTTVTSTTTVPLGSTTLTGRTTVTNLSLTTTSTTFITQNFFYFETLTIAPSLFTVSITPAQVTFTEFATLNPTITVTTIQIPSTIDFYQSTITGTTVLGFTIPIITQTEIYSVFIDGPPAP